MNLGIGVNVTTTYQPIPAVALDPDAAIAALFSSGEVGAWYDPSDSTTVFQDAAGTTPATVGDPVGLILDKSQGGAGSELLSDYTTGFTETGTLDVAVVGSEVVATVDGSSSFAGFYYPISTVPGKQYHVTGYLRSPTANTMYLAAHYSTLVPGGFINRTSSYSSASTAVGFFFTATGATTYIFVYGSTSTVGHEYAARDISIRELPGNHATQTTSAARPVLQSSGGLYYLDFDGVDDYIQTAAFASLQAQPNTLSFAFKHDSTGTYQSLADSTGSGQRHIFRATNSTYEMYAGSFFNTGVSPTTNDTVSVSHFNSTSSYLRINGAEAATGSVGALTWQSLRIGADLTPQYFLNGRIYSFVGVNRTLTAGEITDLESYLAAKSGVTL